MSMSKPITKTLVPDRRFPEFRNAGEWALFPIGEKVDLLSGYPFEGSEIVSDSTGIPLMRGINITEGIVRHSQGIDRFFHGNTKGLEKYLLRNTDLVIGMDGSKVGKNSALITEKDTNSLLVQRVARLRAKHEATIRFIFQQINSSKFHLYVDRINTSGGIPHISAKQICDFKIHFSTIGEQQKIADCLSSIDELITTQAQKLDTLKTHKKGLMQHLFPAEGATVPTLRFPEFQNAGAWEENPLGDICKMQAGKFVSATDIQEQVKNGLHPCYGGNGLRGYTKTHTHKGKYSLIGRQGALCGNVTLATGKFHATEHAVIVTPNKGVGIDWLFYMLRYSNLNQYATGQAQPGLSVENIEKVSINIPDTEREQQKIAACLSSIDKLITAQTQKLDILKAHKKGLMQQLFPSIDEVGT